MFGFRKNSVLGRKRVHTRFLMQSQHGPLTSFRLTFARCSLLLYRLVHGNQQPRCTQARWNFQRPTSLGPRCKNTEGLWLNLSVAGSRVRERSCALFLLQRSKSVEAAAWGNRLVINGKQNLVVSPCHSVFNRWLNRWRRCVWARKQRFSALWRLLVPGNQRHKETIPFSYSKTA